MKTSRWLPLAVFAALAVLLLGLAIVTDRGERR